MRTYGLAQRFTRLCMRKAHLRQHAHLSLIRLVPTTGPGTRTGARTLYHNRFIDIYDQRGVSFRVVNAQKEQHGSTWVLHVREEPFHGCFGIAVPRRE